MRYCALAVICVFALGAAFREGAADVTIGVVDMASALSKYEKWRDMQKLMQERRQLRAKELEALAKEVEALQEKLAGQDPASTSYVETQGLLIQKETLLETSSQRYEIELRRSEEVQYDRLVDEVTAAVGALARELGLGVVIQRALDVPEGTWESVLYVDPRLDLTDRLTEDLNKKYQAEKR